MKTELVLDPKSKKFICHINLDADGCVLKEGESLEAFFKRIELLIQDILRRAQGAEVLIITCGSNRQFIETDAYNSFSHNNGAFLYALLHIQQALQSRLKGKTKLVFDQTMLQDIFTGQPSGSTAKKILKALGPLGKSIPSYPAEYKKRSSFAVGVRTFFKDFLFDYKILLYYAMHHKLRRDYPGYQIRSAIYDDRRDIFQNAMAFNKQIPFFPTDCLVDFCEYGNREEKAEITSSYSSTLTDKDDPNYEATILALSQVPDFFERGYHSLKIDPSKIGPIVDILKQRSDHRHDQKEIDKDKKLLLNLYIKKFKPCPNLKEITTQLRQAVDEAKRENLDQIIELAVIVDELAAFPFVTHHHDFSIYKIRFPLLVAAIEEFAKKLKIEDPKSILKQMAVTDDEEYKSTVRYEFLTAIKDFISTKESKITGEGAEKLLELFSCLTDIESDKEVFSILNRNNIRYLGIHPELDKHFEIYYKKLINLTCTTSMKNKKFYEGSLECFLNHLKINQLLGNNPKDAFSSQLKRFVDNIYNNILFNQGNNFREMVQINQKTIFKHLSNIFTNLIALCENPQELGCIDSQLLPSLDILNGLYWPGDGDWHRPDILCSSFRAVLENVKKGVVKIPPKQVAPVVQDIKLEVKLEEKFNEKLVVHSPVHTQQLIKELQNAQLSKLRIIDCLKSGAVLGTILEKTGNTIAAEILKAVIAKKLDEKDFDDIKTVTKLPLEVKPFKVSWIQSQLLYTVIPDSKDSVFSSSLAKFSYSLTALGLNYHEQWTCYNGYDGFLLFFQSQEAEEKFSVKVKHGLERIEKYGKNIVEMIKGPGLVVSEDKLSVTNDSYFSWMTGPLRTPKPEELKNQKNIRSAIISIVFKAINKSENALDCFQEIQNNLEKLTIPKEFEILYRFKEQLMLRIAHEISLHASATPQLI